MSRRINLDEPLSDEDEQYLADRNRTVDEERENQESLDRIESVVELDEDGVAAKLEYARRNGIPITAPSGRQMGRFA